MKVHSGSGGPENYPNLNHSFISLSIPHHSRNIFDSRIIPLLTGQMSRNSPKPSRTPLDAEFEAAILASNQDYEDRVATLTKAMPEDMELSARIRCYILGFLSNRYDSRLRVMLKRTCRNDMRVLYKVEEEIVQELQNTTKQGAIKVHQPSRPLSPIAIILTGVGAAVGGAAVAVTAGLAAPIILPPLAAALGAGALAGGAGVAALATVCGAAGAGWSGYKVSRHFTDIASMTLHPVKPVQTTFTLGLNICVSGWYTNVTDLPAHWSFMSADSVVLEYERELMEALGNLWENMAVSTVAGMALGEALRTTVLGSALAAIAWPLTLIQLGGMVDHPWWLAVGRSRKCGVALAKLLLDNTKSAQGVRPVSLFGVSMGAIVIQHCLEELARIGACGIVEDVLLLGLPAKLPPPDRLARMRNIVAGRFVHGYSRKDWLLSFLYRTTRLHVGEVAGLVPWDVVGIESVDLTSLVNNHTEYRDKLEEIVVLLNLH
jgi:hypothetical protein